MKTKLFTLLVALITTTSLWAYDFKSGDLYYNITSNTAPYTVKVTYQEKWSSDNYLGLATATIPASVTYNGTTYSVTSIGISAFYHCSSLTSITIPNSVTSIGADAFSDTGIYNTESNWDKGVLYIDNCLIDTKVDISGAYAVKEDTRLIADFAFSYCPSLTSVTIPNNVTNMGGGIFWACRNLQSVVLPENITAISNAMDDDEYVLRSTGFFESCSSLTAVTIPSTVTLIEKFAFAYCSSLTSITLNSPTPPHVEMYDDPSTFEDVDNSIPIYVPCGCVDAYRNSDWRYFPNIQEPPAEYAIDLTINDSKMGTAHVDKNNACGNQISATANYGYHLAQWSDGNTDNPRSLELTQDTILTAEFAPNNYTISTLCNDTERGTTSGDVTTTYLDYVTISATVNYGYHFSHWDDYNYDNPRQVQVTEDKTYTAYFDKNTYYITKHYDSNQGYVDGYPSGDYLDNITLTAEPNYGYHFVRWSDGNTENPRHFVLTQDTTFVAEFAQTFSGQCGDNLYWSYKNNTLTISGSGDMYNDCPWGLFAAEINDVVLPNAMTYIGSSAFSSCTSLTSITIPNSVTRIGDYAFSSCSSLTSVTIPNSVTNIGYGAFEDCEKLGTVILGDKIKEIGTEAFNGCNKLYHIYCYAPEPPMAYESSFANYNINLYVPCNYLDNYKYDRVFGSFRYIQCIDSEDVATNDVVVTPGTNDVTITWPTEDGADTYTIVINKGNEVFCTLTFNADGQLLNIAFAPSRDGNNRPVQYAAQTVNGYRFTVTGLTEATQYAYNITTKDAANKTIATYSGEFTTNGGITTAVEDILQNTINCQKIIRNGQLLILRDGKTYTIMGQVMKEK